MKSKPRNVVKTDTTSLCLALAQAPLRAVVERHADHAVRHQAVDPAVELRRLLGPCLSLAGLRLERNALSHNNKNFVFAMVISAKFIRRWIL